MEFSIVGWNLDWWKWDCGMDIPIIMTTVLNRLSFHVTLSFEFLMVMVHFG